MSENVSNDVIKKVVASMSDKLDPDQLTYLEATLIVSLHGLKVEEECTAIAPVVQDWEWYLKRFRATKRLKNCSESTLKQYEFSLDKFRERIAKMPQEVQDNDIKYFLAIYGETPNKNGKKPSKTYINNMRQNLCAFFSWMTAEGYISRNPVLNIPHVKTPKVIKRAYSGEDMEQMKFAIKNLRDRALVYFLDATGCRIGEALSIDKDMINWSSRSIIIYGQKGKAEREIYFTEECGYHLKKYLDSRTDDNPALFVARRAPYNRLSVTGAETSLRKMGKKIGIHVHPHRFRRTMITRCDRRGMALQDIQRIAGHAKPEATQIYIDAARTNIRSTYMMCS